MTVNRQLLSLPEASRRAGVPPHVVRSRLAAGLIRPDALAAIGPLRPELPLFEANRVAEIAALMPVRRPHPVTVV